MVIYNYVGWKGSVSMQEYKNIGGNSNVKEFWIGTDYIDVRFNGTDKIYRYSYNSAGKEHVEQMKKLAKVGHGLNSYINHYVSNAYER